MKRIIFQINCSENYGLGHLFRCIKIANELRKKNKIYFLIDTKKKEILNYLPKKTKKFFFRSKNFLDQKKKIKNILEKLNKPILIIDSYETTYNFEKYIYNYTNKLIVIDDTIKKHYCDVYINQNYLDFKKLNYFKNRLVGTNFSIIKKNKYALKKPNIKSKNRVLVFMGGSDTKNYTFKIFKVVNSKDFQKFKFTFIIGTNNQYYNYLMNFKKISNIKFLNIMKNFPKLLYEHQFILCSGGSTIWEALYLNKKPLVINTSVKQFENSKNLSKDGLIKLFHQNMTTYNIKKFLLSELKLDKTYFKKKIIDGHGLNRITKEILNEKKG